ncbi:MAG TPA: transporter substrate-binding domain-containing protein [Candidatus Cloacimonadota bacterium]|nr:transporter substrate-binding domain-containing protein [Candidatus Cloacimonadota bacterium]
MKNTMLCIALLITIMYGLYSEVVKVGLEAFPPMIRDKQTGYMIEILKKIESNTNNKFQIDTMPYNRAKNELKSGALDLISLTPYGLETKEFYVYAQEIDLEIGVKTDLYVKDPNKLKDITKLKIGIPRGNEDFASELLGISKDHFYLGEIDNLLRMLDAGRLDAFWFERSATMRSLRGLIISGFHYKQYPQDTINIGFAVQKNEKGNKLKKMIEEQLKIVDKTKILGDYNRYFDLPSEGIVKH